MNRVKGDPRSCADSQIMMLVLAGNWVASLVPQALLRAAPSKAAIATTAATTAAQADLEKVEAVKHGQAAKSGGVRFC